MSHQAIQQFVTQVNNNPSLQEKIKGFTGIPEETYRKVVNLAQENGFDFSSEDWKKYPKCNEVGKSAHGFDEWSSSIIVPWLR